MSNQAATLELRALSCERGGRLLFDKLEQRIDSGAALRVHGANGSGKTTLLKIVAGLRTEFEGSVLWRGQRTSALGPRFRSELFFLGHCVGIKAALTPRENLRWWLSLQSHGSEAVDKSEPNAMADGHGVEQALCQFGLGAMLDTPCTRLSAGQQRRAALARLCLARQALWVLDEPATAIDAEGIGLLERLCEAHLQRGGLLLLTTHQPLQISGLRELELSVPTADFR
ncbi:MAG: cytochrome c biogenesis heme-transporting ATPase CcmA [Pseudomonadales bacterium]|nr:cytochrome c biogenesis heme-transporting ATPase CcmA [Pseudomonadales bacterium]